MRLEKIQCSNFVSTMPLPPVPLLLSVFAYQAYFSRDHFTLSQVSQRKIFAAVGLSPCLFCPHISDASTNFSL